MSSKNYYDILGLNKNCSEKDISKAFKKLSLKWHPDRWATGTDEEKKLAEEKFKEINEANSVLSDSNKRHNYDMYGDPNGRGFDPFQGMDMDDFFSVYRSRQEPQIVKGETHRVIIDVSLNEIFNGGVRNIEYRRNVVCSECGGSGLSSNGRRDICPNCNGSGRMRTITRNGNATFIQETICPHCHGNGIKIVNPCHKCNGSGLASELNSIEINIPVGVSDGDGFTLNGLGSQPYNGEGINGDLIVIFKELPHKRFKRNGNDLYYDVHIDFVDALCGTDVTLESIDGSNVKFNIPSLTKENRTFKLSGKGMKSFNDVNTRGNLYVVIKFIYPETINQKQIELLKEFKKLNNCND